MGKRIGREKHKRRPGYLLYVGKTGYVEEAKMKRRGRRRSVA